MNTRERSDSGHTMKPFSSLRFLILSLLVPLTLEQCWAGSPAFPLKVSVRDWALLLDALPAQTGKSSASNFVIGRCDQPFSFHPTIACSQAARS